MASDHWGTDGIWHFGDPLREQRHLDDGSWVVDLSDREVVTISGKDRAHYLNLLGTQKLDPLSVGQSTSTYLLNAQGHIAYFLALVAAEDVVWGWTEPGCGQGLVDHLNFMRFRMDVLAELRPEIAVMWSGTPEDAYPMREGTPNCLGGYEVFLPRDANPLPGNPAGFWAYTARRIAAGIPRYLVDTDDRTIPNELGVPSECVVLDKGCYPGQETVAKIHNLGAPPRRLVRLHIDGSDDWILSPGTPLALASDLSTSIGFLGSVAYHHELGPIALGLVKRETDDGIRLMADGVPATMEPLVSRDVGLHLTTTLTPRSRRKL